MVDRAQQIADELKNISVTKDAYELWLENDVTRAFRLKIEQEYIEVCEQKVTHSTIEQIAIHEITRSANATALQSVLEWTPDF